MNKRISKMKPKFLSSNWEYKNSLFKNHELHQNPDCINENGWEVVSVSPDNFYPNSDSVLVIYKRELEYDTEKSPWIDTYEKYLKHKSKIDYCLDNIKRLMPLLYKAMDDYYGSTVKSDELYMPAHELTVNANIINEKLGQRELGRASAAGTLFLYFIKFQKETSIFNDLIDPIKRDCDTIFYYTLGYDVRYSKTAPDMLDYFFGKNWIGRILRNVWFNNFASSFAFSLVISTISILLINSICHNWFNQPWFYNSSDLLSHYFEQFILELFPLTACFFLADKFMEETNKKLRLFGWRKLNWGIFIIRSRITRYIRIFLKAFHINL